MRTNKLKAVLIDPATQTVEAVELDEGLEALRDAIHCDYVDAVSLGDGLTLWVDDEGLYSKESPQFFEIIETAQPIAGRGVVLMTNDSGDSVSLPEFVTANVIRSLISFVEYDNPPEPRVEFYSF